MIQVTLDRTKSSSESNQQYSKKLDEANNSPVPPEKFAYKATFSFFSSSLLQLRATLRDTEETPDNKLHVYIHNVHTRTHTSVRIVRCIDTTAKGGGELAGAVCDD